MAASARPQERNRQDPPLLLLGGFAALAESAWMGAAQASDVLAPAFVGHLLAPGFDPPTSALTVTLTRLMLIQPLILAAGSVATAVLNSRSQFLLTALSVASHNVALILGILATRLHPALGI